MAKLVTNIRDLLGGEYEGSKELMGKTGKEFWEEAGNRIRRK